MRDCPDDRTLERLFVGEGSGAQRHHLAGCPECALRMRRIERDVERIREALFEDPPLELLRRSAARPARPLLGALVLGAAAACVAAVFWMRPFAAEPPGNPFELAGFVHTASQALFPAIEEDPGTIASPLATLGVALTGERPCTFGDPLDAESCDAQDVTTLAQGW